MTWLDYPGHGWALLAGALVCVLAGLGFYRLFQVRRLHGTAIFAAGVCQGLCALGVLLILWNPCATQDVPQVARNRVLVVMDTSQSMSIEDTPRGSRLDAAITAFETHARPGDETGPHFQILGLDTTLYGCDDMDQLTRWGSHSRIRALSRRLADLIQEANDTDPGAEISGVVLMTDGQFEDTWRWPGTLAWPDSFEAVVIGVGSPDLPSDVSVTELRAPGQVPQGSVCPVEITVSRTEDSQDPLILDVVLDDVTVQQVSLEPDRWVSHQGQAHQTVTCQWPMQAPGRHVLGARIRPMEGEMNPANNEAWTVIEVAEPRTNRVLLYSRRATLQVGKLRRVLEADQRVILDVCLDAIKDRRLARKSSYAGRSVAFPYEPNEFAVYDLIVMVTQDETLWDAAQRHRLYEFVTRHGGGLMVFAEAEGQGALRWPQEILGRLLPVTPMLTQSEPAMGVLGPSQEAQEARLFQGVSLAQHDLPVLAWPMGRPKPASTCLAVVDHTPAVLTHRVGEGHVCVVGLSKLFQLYCEDQQGGTLFDLISTLVRMTAPEPGQDSGLRVFAERVPDQPDQLWITAWIKDQAAGPVEDAAVLATVESQVVTLSAMGRGRYRALVPYAGPPCVVVRVEAQVRGQYLGQSVTAVRLPSVRTEMSRIQLNEPGLADLSQAMQAEYVNINKVDRSTFERFEGRRTLSPTMLVTSQWPRWIVLCLLCVLLCASWSIRRSLGMG